MKRMRRMVVVGLVAGAAAAAHGASVRYGTEAEARALLDKAVALYRKEGAAAIEAIGKPAGPFVQRDLYVVVIGPDKKIAADAAEPELVGSEIATLRDPLGKPWALLLQKQATEDGVVVDYEAKNPQTGKVEDKSAVGVRVGDWVFSCGYYLPPPKPAEKAASEAPKPGQENWAGKWTTTDADGSPYTITLDPSGTAQSGRGEGQQGFWIPDAAGARIDWTDGWTDYLVPSSGAFERLAFAPGAPRDEKPESTTPVTREK
ncbi:MAG TPA: cache domain-containing protein [Thermoanaerobaculia bacterium]|nr:cache domain-containing protein [Thermoanaerobaculia bacterium]